MIRVVDALVAFAMLIAAAIRLLFTGRGRPSTRILLLLDTSYDLAALESRGALSLVLSRDLEGFFDRVIHAHPLVGASPAHREDAYGAARVVRLSDRHFFLEGHSEWRPDSRWVMTSFARAQLAFVDHLKKLISAQGVSVVQASDPYYPGLLALLIARRHGAALVIRVAGNYDLIYETTGRLAYPKLLRSRRLEKWLARLVLSRATLVLPANENNQGFAVDNGAAADRCLLVPSYGNVLNPAHLSDPATRGGANGVPDGPFLLVISRLESVKHAEDAIEVLAHLRKKGHDLPLVIAGDGSLRSELKGLAHRLGVGNDVRFMGECSQGWIAKAAAQATAILAPRSGRALVEALLGGRPVVAYDVEWHGEAITDGVNGFLVPNRDRIAMAEVAERLLSDPVLATDVGRKGREHTLGVVDPNVVRNLQREAYEVALSRGRP